MAYMIQGWDEAAGQWDESLVGNDSAANTFETEAEAQLAIESLRENGDEWADAEYRIVERPEQD